MQGDDVTVTGSKLTGTLKKLTGSNPITDLWGEGYFACLQFSDIPTGATSVKVGLDPSEGSGLVEIINDPDLNGVFKITDKDEQVFKVVTTIDGEESTVTYDLSGLNLVEE